MEKSKKVSDVTKVTSRNRNKNRNKTLQNRVKVREEIKKEKAKRLAAEVENAVEEAVVEFETSEVALRDDIVVVPDRKVVVDEVVEFEDEEVVEVYDNTADEEVNDTLESIDYNANFVDDEEEKVEVVEVSEDKDDDFVSVEVNKFRFVEDEEEKLAKTAKFKFVDLEKDFENNDEIGVVLEEFHNNDNCDCEKDHECKCGDNCNCGDSKCCHDECCCGDDYNKEVKTMDVKDELITPPTDKVDIEARRYVSFEKRVILLITVIILSFFLAGTFIFKAVNKEDSSKVTYDEVSDVEYNVCINELTYNQYYSNSCLDENMEYLTSISERIPTIFN